MSVRDSINEALKSRSIVRLFREGIEEGWFTGRILSAGDALFALEVIDDSHRLNGVSVLQYENISRFDSPSVDAAVVEKVLELRPGKAWRGFELGGALSSYHDLLERCAQADLLLSLYCEKTEPEMAFVGKIDTLSDDKVTLRLLNAHAKWEPELERFFLDEVTRIDLGAAYEAGLLLVADAAGEG